MSMQSLIKSGGSFITAKASVARAWAVIVLRYVNGQTLLALAGIIGPLFWTIGDLTAGFATSNYSIINNSISSLALTGIGWLQTIGFLALGLFVELFAAGLLFNIKRARWFHLGVGLFVIFGFGMLCVGAFRTDPVGTHTLEGKIHGLVATTAFVLFPIAILCLMPSIKKDNNWQTLYRYTGVVFILSVILVVLSRVFHERNSWFGLVERMLVWNMILWVEVSAVRMFILSIKRVQNKLASRTAPATARDAIQEDF